jgi:hypothetical protein
MDDIAAAADVEPTICHCLASEEALLHAIPESYTDGVFI